MSPVTKSKHGQQAKAAVKKHQKAPHKKHNESDARRHEKQQYGTWEMSAQDALKVNFVVKEI